MFRYEAAVHRVWDITPSLLASLQVRGLLLDIDNTLTTHDNPVPAPGVTDWIAQMREADIGLCLVSNNHPPRVAPFAETLGLPYVCEGRKPLSKGYREAVEILGLPKKETAVVGDQIFTDVWGANLFHVPCILVEPMQLETTRFFRFKRALEKPFWPHHFDEASEK